MEEVGHDLRNYKLYEILVALITFFVIFAIPVWLGAEFVSLFRKLLVLWILFLSLKYVREDFHKMEWLYCLAILVGFMFHKISGVKEAHLESEALIRIVPIVVISHFRFCQAYVAKFAKGFALSFFVIECLLAIYEKLTLSHVVDYVNDFQATNSIMNFDEVFRSFSLMTHPLWNANVVSIFLAFILCTSNLRPLIKALLIVLGMGAIWSFNSRGCMMIWGLLLIYRLFFYKRKIKWMIGALILLYTIIPIFIIYVQATGVLGRLDFDFGDNSTLTRIWAFEIFFDYPWTLRDVIYGGNILYYPGIGMDEVSLENGALLDLAYWGFIIGSIKIVGEIMISYKALLQFQGRDKIIIMIAFWGVAFMNNNSFNFFLMVFFMCAFISFGLNQSQIQKVQENVQ